MKRSFGEIINDTVPVLVDFYADWCGPCKTMAPALEAFSSETGMRLKVIKVDVDKNPQVAINYKIQGVPTLMLFKSGKVLWRQSGALSAHQLRQFILPLI